MERNNLKMWKNIYLIILTLVTIGCIIYGIVKHTSGARHWFSSDQDYQKSDEMTVLNFESFDDIMLNVAIGDLSIVYGDAYQVEYNYPEKLKPEVNLRDRVLTIDQKQGKGGVNFFGFGNWDTLGDMDYDLVITIPKDTKIGDVNLSMDMGNIQIDDINMEDLTIDADMGNIEANQISFAKMDMDADMGNIEMNKVVFDRGECDADMGSIELKNATFDRLECDADMGSIEIDGDFQKLTANCSMGSVTVTTKEDPDDLTLDLSADMGVVTVNGKDKGREYYRK